eukprot:5036311-Prymnesium_polylepis.1
MLGRISRLSERDLNPQAPGFAACRAHVSGPEGVRLNKLVSACTCPSRPLPPCTYVKRAVHARVSSRPWPIAYDAPYEAVLERYAALRCLWHEIHVARRPVPALVSRRWFDRGLPWKRMRHNKGRDSGATPTRTMHGTRGLRHGPCSV